MTPPSYSSEYFDWQSGGSRDSAEVIVPKVIELLQPKSVLDVGCGVGTWLSVFWQLGIRDIKGVDGSYIPRDKLLVPQERFTEADLAKEISLGRKFDVAVSLEVAEHLPEQASALFIDSLTKHADKVVFSAAIPFQGGPNHVNEQWPDYWAKLFREKGFIAVDVFRKEFWNNEKVEWWYRQNILLFVKKEILADYKNLESFICDDPPLSLVHPRCFEDTVAVCKEQIREKRYSDGANF